MKHTDGRKGKSHILDFKFSPCPECCMLLLVDSPASEFYMLTFRDPLFHLHRQVGACVGEPNLFPYNTPNMSPA